MIGESDATLGAWDHSSGYLNIDNHITQLMHEPIFGEFDGPLYLKLTLHVKKFFTVETYVKKLSFNVNTQ
jgi:hypothetical protein